MEKNNFSQTPDGQRKFVERRRKKDWVVRSVSVIAVIGWICAIVALVYVDQAKPGTVNFLTKLFGTDVRLYWDVTLLNISFRALLVSFFTCVIGLLINMTRHRRKTDRFNKSIIILGLVSLIAIIAFLINNYAILSL